MLIVTPIILLILLSVPLLDKKYTAGGRYVFWILVMITLVLPFVSFLPAPAIEINVPIPAVRSEAVVSEADVNVPFAEAPTQDFTLHTSDAYVVQPPGIVYGNIGGRTGDIGSQPDAADSRADAAGNQAEDAIVSSQATTVSGQTDTAAGASFVQAIFADTSLQQAIIAIWILGAFVSLVVHVSKYVLFKRFVRRWSTQETDLSVESVFDEELARLKIKKEIKLYRCKNINSPMLTGFLRPMILLPEVDFGHMDLPLIFRHELTHYKRRDLWYKAALVAVRCIYWFNPVIHLMVRQAYKDIELICDTLTVQDLELDLKKQYSEIILNIAAGVPARTSSLTTSMDGNKKMLKQRFSNILGTNKKRGIALFTIIGILAVTAALTVGASFGTENGYEEAGLEQYDDLNKEAELYTDDLPNGMNESVESDVTGAEDHESERVYEARILTADTVRITPALTASEVRDATRARGVRWLAVADFVSQENVSMNDVLADRMGNHLPGRLQEYYLITGTGYLAITVSYAVEDAVFYLYYADDRANYLQKLSLGENRIGYFSGLSDFIFYNVVVRYICCVYPIYIVADDGSFILSDLHYLYLHPPFKFSDRSELICTGCEWPRIAESDIESEIDADSESVPVENENQWLLEMMTFEGWSDIEYSEYFYVPRIHAKLSVESGMSFWSVQQTRLDISAPADSHNAPQFDSVEEANTHMPYFSIAELSAIPEAAEFHFASVDGSILRIQYILPSGTLLGPSIASEGVMVSNGPEPGSFATDGVISLNSRYIGEEGFVTAQISGNDDTIMLVEIGDTKGMLHGSGLSEPRGDEHFGTLATLVWVQDDIFHHLSIHTIRDFGYMIDVDTIIAIAESVSVTR